MHHSTTTTASGGNWAVSTPHSAASAAAADSFRRGGNAVDAALAAAAILTVVYPNQCSIGGDLIALVGTPDGAVSAVNATGRAPKHLDYQQISADYGAMPVAGALTVTVPGVISGWDALAARWGTRPFGEALVDAEVAARDGVPVADGVARDIGREAVKIADDPALRELLMPTGSPLVAGDTLRQERLADAFALLRSEGALSMYGGAIGSAIATELREQGSSMTIEDFAAHHITTDSGVSTMFAGTEYVTSSGNSQGLYFLAGLRAVGMLCDAGKNLDALGESAGRIALILSRTAAERDHNLGEVDDLPAIAATLLSDEHAEEMLRPGMPEPAMRFPPANGDTAAVTTVDASGLWVSLLQSVFHGFGAGILEPRFGIVLQNRGASFSLRPGAPNRLTAGRRPPHTLMPVITRQAGKITSCRAVMGGRAQPQIQTQLALQLSAGASAQEAVSRPRWILGVMEATHSPSKLSVAKLEADVPQAAADSIAAAGFSIEYIGRRDDEGGHAHIVRLSGSTDPDSDNARDMPRLEAASDPRTDGSAFAE